jgi:hypothetical protein
MSGLSRAGVGAFWLSCVLACGAETDAPEAESGNTDQPAASGQDGGRPASPGSRQAPNASSLGTISEQTSASCVSLPMIPPREPVLSYAAGCAVTSLQPMSEMGIMAADHDARQLLVGRWRLCGGSADYGGFQHARIEFGSNGRNQLLQSNADRLQSIDGAQGVYYLLESGQFMQRGKLTLNRFASFISVDPTLSVIQIVPAEDSSAPTPRYVRVQADERSAAANTFSTATDDCSLVGVWDTAPDSKNPAAAFAFNEHGEWYGGPRGADLCAEHSMYGTYNLQSPDQPIMDTFDLLDLRFDLVTNVGAGRCEFWLSAGFLPIFSDDCNRVQLELSYDNCTGGRGYLKAPGDELSRRLPR